MDESDQVLRDSYWFLSRGEVPVAREKTVQHWMLYMLSRYERGGSPLRAV